MNGRGERTRVRRLNRLREFESSDEALRRSASGFHVAANCLLFRSSALAQAQYYGPTKGWSAGEDWSLCIRLAANGWGDVYAPWPLTNYRQWDDILHTRAARTMEEVSNLKSIYEDMLMPEYDKRSWNTGILKRNMRRKAVRFASVLDSPLFNDAEREMLKGHLRKLGSSFQLSLAILLAEVGFNPVLRFIGAAKVGAKDFIKSCIRVVRPPEGKKGKRTNAHIYPARNDDGKS